MIPGAPRGDSWAQACLGLVLRIGAEAERGRAGQLEGTALSRALELEARQPSLPASDPYARNWGAMVVALARGAEVTRWPVPWPVEGQPTVACRTCQDSKYKSTEPRPGIYVAVPCTACAAGRAMLEARVSGDRERGRRAEARRQREARKFERASEAAEEQAALERERARHERMRRPWWED